ncbi:hypothetical protein P0D95_32500 [Pseudomonas sp. CBSPCAW29]|nr:hypothetical protein P0D95_32500 [Pseudomonas sp. CBSPCAW29]
MIEPLFKALHHYNEAYRELINEKAMRHTPDHGDFEVFIQSALKLTTSPKTGASFAHRWTLSMTAF